MPIPVPFKPNTDVPAFGVMYVTGTTTQEGSMVIETKKPDGLAFGEIIAINGPSAVGSGKPGTCYMAGDVPVHVLVDGGVAVAAGDVCGPKDGEWDLFKDFPGLIAFDSADGNFLAWVRIDPDPVMRIEMKDDLPTSPGAVAKEQTGTAYRLKADDTIDTGTELEVFDELGVFRCRGNGTFSDPHDRGSQGLVGWNRDQDRVEIRTMQPHALQIKGALTADLLKATGSFDIDGVTVMQPPGAIITDTDPATATFGIDNRLFDGDEDAICIATWDEPTQSWLNLDTPCPA